MDNQVNPFAEKVIPLLTARDVDLRTSRVDKEGKWVALLAYKDARVDMRILDEIYGPMNWQRSHTIIDGQLFCTVSVWDENKGQWISKQDVGVESKTEAEKGRASDSFKRACFNLGIGRELYDAPKSIKIYLKPGEDSRFVKFFVKSMKYNKELGEYEEFTIVDKNGSVRFSLDDEESGSATQKANNNPEQIKNIEDTFGCTVAPVDKEGYAKLEKGKWLIRSKKNDKWYSVWDKIIPLNVLEAMLQDEDYASAHHIIKNVIARKKND